MMKTDFVKAEMANVMNVDNNDAFPQLGSVYRKDSDGRYVNRLTARNAENVNVTSVLVEKIAVKGWRPQSSLPNVWGGSNLVGKQGRQYNGGGNAWTTKNADTKSLSTSGNEMSRQGGCMEQGCRVTSTHSCLQKKEDLHTGCHVSDACDDKTSIVSKSDDGNCDGADQVMIGSSDDDDDEVLIGSSDDDDEVLIGSSDDDVLFDDNSEEDMNEKRRKWFKPFFDSVNKLRVEELNSPAKKWHCPACKGGPGAIDWYRGLEPLMFHAMTRKASRVKLHRVFAELLNEETLKRGVSVAPSGVAYGKWKGLDERTKDYDIVWPSMVVIMNTQYDQDENGKWVGMGNQELLEEFRSYAALKARHSYGPQGHRGMSVLIFDDTTAGYLEAVRLHLHFKEQGRDREAWMSRRFPHYSGGKRQLYGYIATKEDLEFFNKYSQGRSRLKFEMRSYRETVEIQIKKINENNQEHAKCKDKMDKEHKVSQILIESVTRLRKELEKTTEENCNVREQTKSLIEEKKEELAFQEQFFIDQIKFLQLAIDSKADKVEGLQQLNQEDAEKLNLNRNAVDDTYRREHTVSITNLKDKDIDELDMERKKLRKNHEEKKALILERCWKELLQLEKEYENALLQLMKKYNSDHPKVEEDTTASSSHQF